MSREALYVIDLENRAFEYAMSGLRELLFPERFGFIQIPRDVKLPYDCSWVKHCAYN